MERQLCIFFSVFLYACYQCSAQTECPNNIVCPSKNTCCPKKGGGFLCCPTVNATCCEDGVHCCPFSYSCKTTYCQKSENDEESSALRHPLKLRGRKLEDILCPDGHRCTDNQTCCLTTSGTYGCCPLPNATRCLDGTHCCPQGYSCDGDKCIDRRLAKDVIRAYIIEKAHEGIEPSQDKTEEPENITCPDGHTCGNNQTCCLTPAKTYGCCSLPFAVCCPNGGCCPYEYPQCEGDRCVRFSVNGLLLKRSIRQFRVKTVRGNEQAKRGVVDVNKK